MDSIIDIRKPVFGKDNRSTNSALLYEKLCEFHNALSEHLVVQKNHYEFRFEPDVKLLLLPVSCGAGDGATYRFRVHEGSVPSAIRIENDFMLLPWRVNDNGVLRVFQVKIPTDAIIEISGIITETRERYVFPKFTKDGPIKRKPLDHSEEGRAARVKRAKCSTNGGRPALRVVEESKE